MAEDGTKKDLCPGAMPAFSHGCFALCIGWAQEAIYMTMGQTVLLLLFLGLLAIGILFACLRVHGGCAEERIPYDRPDFCDRAGFEVNDLPGDEIVQLQRCFLCYQKTVGELEFLIDPGWKALVRVARAADSLHLEDLNSQYDTNRVLYPDGVRVLVRTGPGGRYLASWTRDNFHYAFYFEGGEMGMAGGLMDDFVREMEAKAG